MIELWYSSQVHALMRTAAWFAMFRRYAQRDWEVFAATGNERDAAAAVDRLGGIAAQNLADAHRPAGLE